MVSKTPVAMKEGILVSIAVTPPSSLETPWKGRKSVLPYVCFLCSGLLPKAGVPGKTALPKLGLLREKPKADPLTLVDTHCDWLHSAYLWLGCHYSAPFLSLKLDLDKWLTYLLDSKAWGTQAMWDTAFTGLAGTVLALNTCASRVCFHRPLLQDPEP